MFANGVVSTFDPLRTLTARVHHLFDALVGLEYTAATELLAAMLAFAATPWLLLGWVPDDWGALVGGTSFLAMAQLIAWCLFVGLKTGRMPSAYGSSELRAEAPTWFWLTGAIYAGLLLLFLWAGLVVVMDGIVLGF